MANQHTWEDGRPQTSGLQISCSTPELHRRPGQNAPFLDNCSTPVSTPRNPGAAPSTSTDDARKGAGHGREIERFFAFVSPEPNSGCWLWCGGLQSRGYGFFCLSDASMVLAHRYSYELARGPVPDGLEVDHLCRLKACVNPEHLEAVTQSENTLRRYRAARGEPIRSAGSTTDRGAP
jgi:hypothetical protein